MRIATLLSMVENLSISEEKSMTVKELIALLQTLEQEKVIKYDDDTRHFDIAEITTEEAEDGETYYVIG